MRKNYNKYDDDICINNIPTITITPSKYRR